ncbi:carboxymethylenebutenolidase [Prauserella aidingensis]|uniref:dienelactone hydrolase family protein n=1 Tax=Prauserella aidingensis TaxID=387890 RepID=UPI0020A5E1A4|nr:dienelactone hydrolase family protein [Prauserella aidingensis]MCP2256145.1 carboxymethylenebutenolidase [Prauserella aidingensis]
MIIESTQHGGVPLRIARPAQPRSTGVVVLHQANGYAPQTESWLTRLAERGHLAVAPLLLQRRGVESVDPTERFGDDLNAFARFLPGDADVLEDITTALDYLTTEDLDARHTGVLGFSYGGRAAYLIATKRALGGAVTFYGNGIHRESFLGNEHIPALTSRVKSLQTPWLGLYGDQDFLLAEGELDEWQTELTGAPVNTELVRYPDAGHAFDVDQAFSPDMPSPYIAKAAEDASERTLRFFDSTLR